MIIDYDCVIIVVVVDVVCEVIKFFFCIFLLIENKFDEGFDFVM